MPPRETRSTEWIIDLTWILVGPGAMRMLASMGAEVSRIEPTNPAWANLVRFVPPFIQDTPGPPEDPYGLSLHERFDCAGYYFNNNPGKRGVRLNLSTPEGKGIFRRLVAIPYTLTVVVRMNGLSTSMVYLAS